MAIKRTLSSKFFWVILLVGLGLRLVYLSRFSTPITFDHGRDLLALREIWLAKKPALIGPNTSFRGVFYGPLWFYLVLPFFLLSGGHPFSLLAPVWILFLLVPLFFWRLRQDKAETIIFTSLYVFALPFFKNSVTALNTSPAVFLLPLIVVLTAQFWEKKKIGFLFTAAFLSGLFMNFTAIMVIFLAVWWLGLLIFLRRRQRVSWAQAAGCLALFGLAFAPWLLFEARHGFGQIKAILGLMPGQEGFAEAKPVSLTIKIGAVWLVLKSVFEASAVLDVGLLLLGASAAFSFLRQSRRSVLLRLALAFLAVCLGLLLLFPYQVANWHLEPLKGLLLICLAWVLLDRARAWGKEIWFWPLFFAWLLVGIGRGFALKAEKDPLSDPANLVAREQVIRSIYDEAAGRGFSVYAFAPNVYDYPYQYLFYWRAETNYGYRPENYFYLPDQPAYVPGKALADSLVPTKPSQAIYLIMEPVGEQGEWFGQWRGHFGEAATGWQVGTTRVERVEWEIGSR